MRINAFTGYFVTYTHNAEFPAYNRPASGRCRKQSIVKRNFRLRESEIDRVLPYNADFPAYNRAVGGQVPQTEHC